MSQSRISSSSKLNSLSIKEISLNLNAPLNLSQSTKITQKSIRRKKNLRKKWKHLSRLLLRDFTVLFSTELKQASLTVIKLQNYYIKQYYHRWYFRFKWKELVRKYSKSNYIVKLKERQVSLANALRKKDPQRIYFRDVLKTMCKLLVTSDKRRKLFTERDLLTQKKRKKLKAKWNNLYRQMRPKYLADEYHYIFDEERQKDQLRHYFIQWITNYRSNQKDFPLSFIQIELPEMSLKVHLNLSFDLIQPYSHTLNLMQITDATSSLQDIISFNADITENSIELIANDFDIELDQIHLSNHLDSKVQHLNEFYTIPTPRPADENKVHVDIIFVDEINVKNNMVRIDSIANFSLPVHFDKTKDAELMNNDATVHEMKLFNMIDNSSIQDFMLDKNVKNIYEMSKETVPKPNDAEKVNVDVVFDNQNKIIQDSLLRMNSIELFEIPQPIKQTNAESVNIDVNFDEQRPVNENFSRIASIELFEIQHPIKQTNAEKVNVDINFDDQHPINDNLSHITSIELFEIPQTNRSLKDVESACNQSAIQNMDLIGNIDNKSLKDFDPSLKLRSINRIKKVLYPKPNDNVNISILFNDSPAINDALRRIKSLSFFQLPNSPQKILDDFNLNISLNSQIPSLSASLSRIDSIDYFELSRKANISNRDIDKICNEALNSSLRDFEPTQNIDAIKALQKDETNQMKEGNYDVELKDQEPIINESLANLNSIDLYEIPEKTSKMESNTDNIDENSLIDQINVIDDFSSQNIDLKSNLRSLVNLSSNSFNSNEESTNTDFEVKQVDPQLFLTTNIIEGYQSVDLPVLNLDNFDFKLENLNFNEFLGCKQDLSPITTITPREQKFLECYSYEEEIEEEEEETDFDLDSLDIDDLVTFYFEIPLDITCSMTQCATSLDSIESMPRHPNAGDIYELMEGFDNIVDKKAIVTFLLQQLKSDNSILVTIDVKPLIFYTINTVLYQNLINSSFVAQRLLPKSRYIPFVLKLPLHYFEQLNNTQITNSCRKIAQCSHNSMINEIAKNPQSLLAKTRFAPNFFKLPVSIISTITNYQRNDIKTMNNHLSDLNPINLEEFNTKTSLLNNVIRLICPFECFEMNWHSLESKTSSNELDFSNIKKCLPKVRFVAHLFSNVSDTFNPILNYSIRKKLELKPKEKEIAKADIVSNEDNAEVRVRHRRHSSLNKNSFSIIISSEQPEKETMQERSSSSSYTTQKSKKARRNHKQKKPKTENAFSYVLPDSAKKYIIESFASTINCITLNNLEKIRFQRKSINGMSKKKHIKRASSAKANRKFKRKLTSSSESQDTMNENRPNHVSTDSVDSKTALRKKKPRRHHSVSQNASKMNSPL